MMNSKSRLYCALIISLIVAASLRAQDDPVDDPDLKEMLKQAQEIQKNARELQKNPASLESRKKFTEMEAQMKAEAARRELDDKRETDKLQAALNKQLQAPGPVVLPDWTPATPQFKSSGAPTRKIVDEQVRVIQTGTSSLTPKELADGWEAAAVAAKNLNHGRNNIEVNGKLTTIMFLSTRTDPVQEVKLEASRDPGDKITQVEISSPLPKTDVGSE